MNDTLDPRAYFNVPTPPALRLPEPEAEHCPTFRELTERDEYARGEA